MEESKITMTHRLQKEGRWEEASKFKDLAIKDARKNGKKGAEAKDIGWRAMADKYSPLANPSTPSQSVAPDPKQNRELRELGESTLSGVLGDVLWAFNNFEVTDVSPGEAPSRGAWGLLTWARENRDKFYSQMVTKIVAIAEKRIDDADEIDHESEAIANLEELFDLQENDDDG